MRLYEADFILVFGGTFDPPQRAHIELPMQVREKVGADAVAYIPAALSPHKLDQVPTEAHHRVAMLELALKDIDEAVVLTDEIDRADAGEPSYTVETLTRLQSELPLHVKLRLLMGGDQMRAFSRWKSPEKIVEIADPLVMVRPPDTRESLLAAMPEAQRGFWAGRLVDVPLMDISGTEIRRRVTAGESIDDLVPRAVAQYIERHRLYRCPPGVGSQGQGKMPRTL